MTPRGKEVVETYFSAPQTGLDKPYQELAGYAKTDVLAPGASQMVTITYDTTEMSSYDETTSQYVHGRGRLRRSASVARRGTRRWPRRSRLATKTVTEQDSSQLVDDEKPATELTSDPASFYTYDGQSGRDRRSPEADARAPRASRPKQSASAVQQDVAVDSTLAVLRDRRQPDLVGTTAYLDPARRAGRAPARRTRPRPARPSRASRPTRPARCTTSPRAPRRSSSSSPSSASPSSRTSSRAPAPSARRCPPPAPPATRPPSTRTSASPP